MGSQKICPCEERRLKDTQNLQREDNSPHLTAYWTQSPYISGQVIDLIIIKFIIIKSMGQVNPGFLHQPSKLCQVQKMHVFFHLYYHRCTSGYSSRPYRLLWNLFISGFNPSVDNVKYADDITLYHLTKKGEREVYTVIRNL